MKSGEALETIVTIVALIALLPILIGGTWRNSSYIVNTTTFCLFCFVR